MKIKSSEKSSAELKGFKVSLGLHSPSLNFAIDISQRLTPLALFPTPPLTQGLYLTYHINPSKGFMGLDLVAQLSPSLVQLSFQCLCAGIDR